MPHPQYVLGWWKSSRGFCNVVFERIKANVWICLQIDCFAQRFRHYFSLKFCKNNYQIVKTVLCEPCLVTKSIFVIVCDMSLIRVPKRPLPPEKFVLCMVMWCLSAHVRTGGDGSQRVNLTWKTSRDLVGHRWWTTMSWRNWLSQTSRELAIVLECDHTTVLDHLKQIGKVNKAGVWVPHELSPENLLQRMTICSSLLSRQEVDPFLKRIVTGDEKWVLYVNVKRKNQWVDKGEKVAPTAKPPYLKTAISNFFAFKNASYYKEGIERLPQRWSTVIDNNGNYID